MLLTESRKRNLQERCLIPGDSPIEFETYSKRMYRFINPRNAAECVLTDQLVASSWSLLRANKLETISSLPLDANTLNNYKRTKKRLYNRAWDDLSFLRDQL
jgi:hypothetical protein